MMNQQGQMHENMQTGAVPPHLNHGAHEMADVREVLTGTLTALNTYMMLNQHIKDQELKDILNRQYQYITKEYNAAVESFKSGQNPSSPVESYKMTQGNDFIYGLKPSGSPMKPLASPSDMTDQEASSAMLNALKGSAGMKTKAALETTNPVVRRVIADSIPNCIEMAYEISLYQNKHHYYQVPQLPEQDAQQILNSFATVTPGTSLH